MNAQNQVPGHNRINDTVDDETLLSMIQQAMPQPTDSDETLQPNHSQTSSHVRQSDRQADNPRYNNDAAEEPHAASAQIGSPSRGNPLSDETIYQTTAMRRAGQGRQNTDRRRKTPNTKSPHPDGPEYAAFRVAGHRPQPSQNRTQTDAGQNLAPTRTNATTYQAPLPDASSSPDFGIIPPADPDFLTFQQTFATLGDNIGAVVVGKPLPIKLCITALLAGGHILLEDDPGTGKTQLARALASSIDASFKRIQFTPDLLPSDVVGVTFYDQKSGEFKFRPGPIFASIVLADEINRASPKTQSALLEVMEEQKVTVDGVTYDMPQPFIVIATQNPLEQLGTYTLPEAQMDRFLIKTSIGAPDRQTSIEILKQVDVTDRARTISPVLSGDDIKELRSIPSAVHVDERILEYIERLVEATRNSEKLKAGSSMRGALALTRCARVWAASSGRGYVVPDDIKELAVPVLAHRIVLNTETTFRGETSEQIVRQILQTVPAPSIED